MDIEQRIQDFIISSDTTGTQINPYLEWHLNAEATFTHRTTNLSHTVDGFYYKEFEREQSAQSTTDWGWNELSTTHNMRFRFAPPTEGGWDVSISVKLQDGTIFSYCSFAINVTENMDNDGYVKVANNKRVLERNGELFFPVGQDLHWPEDESGIAYGPYSGAWGSVPVNSLAHSEFEADMIELKGRGVNSFRMLLNPASLDIEFEKVGNYTDRLNLGWEIDNIINKAEELDLYIHLDMMVHYALSRNSYRPGWDWSKTIPAFTTDPVYAGHYGYRDFFDAQNDTMPELFFSNSQCIKYYKQKVRYLIGRYGYSTHIYILELLSEANNAGLKSVYNSSGQANGYYDAYVEDPIQPRRVFKWHEIMSNYIKNELGHKQHLVCANYTFNTNTPQNGDSTYYLPEINVVTWNNYSDLINKFHTYSQDRIKPLHQLYDKPILWSETGPLDPNGCDNGTSYRKEAWMTAFTGIAGFNFWAGAEPIYHNQWNYLGNVRNFIEGNQRVANLFLSNNWESQYTNDVGTFLQNGKIHYHPASLKEVNYISGVTENLNGYTTPMKIGVVSNLTDNYFTNTSPGDVTSWCYSNLPASNSNLANKLNLSWDNVSVITNAVGDYFYNWYNYEGTYISSNTYYLHSSGNFPHPLSCAENNCNTLTSEIPFILEWDYSDIYKSNLSNIESIGHNSIDNIENNQLGMHLYPIPSSNNINVICSDEEVKTYIIIDATGKMMNQIPRKGLSQRITITNLEAGFYVILGTSSSNAIKYRSSCIKL